MNLKLKIFSLVLFIFLNTFSYLHAQYIKIIDSNAKIPLPFATLTINNSIIGIISDEFGLISIPSNLQNIKNDTVWITYVGYERYFVQLSKIMTLKQTDTLQIFMHLLSPELPPVIYLPPSPDTLLVYAAINTMNKALSNRQWQSYLSRNSVNKIVNNQKETLSIKEQSGERFANPITPALILGAREPHSWILDEQQRTLENNPKEEIQIRAFQSDLWLNYDFSYYLPLSPQYFEKKIEKIFNKEGQATHFKITMVPLKIGFLSLLKIADRKMSLTYYSLLNTERHFYINMDDTTITELHVISRKEYSFREEQLQLEETERNLHFTFHKTEDQTLYLTYAEITMKIKEGAIKYSNTQQYWFKKPEKAENTSIDEISKRSKAKVREVLFKRDQNFYLFRDDINIKPDLNQLNFWMGIKFPDFEIYSTQYDHFKSDPNYSLFK